MSETLSEGLSRSLMLALSKYDISLEWDEENKKITMIAGYDKDHSGAVLMLHLIKFAEDHKGLW